MLKSLIFLLFVFTVVQAGAQTPALNVADSLFRSGNYTKAIKSYAQVNSGYANLQIARSYNALGNYDKAVKQYDSLLAENPKLLLAKNELGKLLFKLSRFELAEKLFAELTIADPNNPDNHHQLGLIEDERLQYHKAKPHYLKSYGLDSTNLKNIVKLGEYFLRYKKTDSLMRFVDCGLAQDSTSLELINLKALGHYNYQQYEKALPYFEKLINLNQHKVYIYERLGRCYNFMWEYEKAKLSYKKVIALEPGNAEAYFNLGVTHQKLKELDSALINYNEAITVQKVKFDREYSAIATVYREKNDIKNALDNYKKAMAEDPESIFSHNQVVLLSDVYYKDPALKLKLYEEFLEKFKGHQLFGLYNEMYRKRISDLKTEIHLSKE